MCPSSHHGFSDSNSSDFFDRSGLRCDFYRGARCSALGDREDGEEDDEDDQHYPRHGVRRRGRWIDDPVDVHPRGRHGSEDGRTDQERPVLVRATVSTMAPMVIRTYGSTHRYTTSGATV